VNTNIYQLSEKLGLLLKKRRVFVVTAESCTGGLLASSITDVAGSSAYFERGFVVYSNASKQEVLGVKAESLEQFGAVSEQVAKEMADGALHASNAEIGVAITGLAGPNTNIQEGPAVGTVCFAIVGLELPAKAVTMQFNGDRVAVKESAVAFALGLLLEHL